ncbi:hypothetical protein RPHASCH2410_PC01200 (plasmid) [Rhizobium phaseoli Ch24-10]|nr:hypothetical protein RPHASCH2410_PC01200 [Rhizobium phaseoli Ch24-10]
MEPAGNLRHDIEAALQRQNLTGWQRTFLADIHARLERSGGNARLSTVAKDFRDSKAARSARPIAIRGRSLSPISPPAQENVRPQFW